MQLQFFEVKIYKSTTPTLEVKNLQKCASDFLS